MAYNFEKEKREAIDAGNKALESLRTAKENLDSAHNWGLFDMFAGGLISSLAKRSKMKQAPPAYGAGQMGSAKFQRRTERCEYDFSSGYRDR